MKRILFCCIISCITFEASQAQNKQLDEALSELTNDIRQYEVDYQKAAVQRGLNYATGDFTAANLKAAIKEYTEDMFGEGAGNQMQFIFYHFKNDSISIWLFNHMGNIEARHKVAITPDSLMVLENTVKFRIDVENKLLGSRAVGYERSSRKYRLTESEATKQLGKILLPTPIADRIKDARYLLILPCLNISSIPFGMLKPWDNDAIVIDSMSYSFVHNLREFFDTAEASKIGFRYALKNPVIVGNPTFTDRCTNGLQNLPGAEQEAIAVSTLLDTKPFIGAAASKNQLVPLFASSTFIYLATHGYSDPHDVMQASFIALSDTTGCGYLTPAEIQKLRLEPTTIVVLSACETGNGRVMDAGVIGLARGFLKANAKSVIMSLWKVDDEQTKTLMLLFVEELMKEQYFFPAENFRQAILRYKKEVGDLPIHWASFQSFGTPLRFLMPNSLKVEK